MIYRNIVTDTDKMFARQYQNGTLSKTAHALMRRCKEDKAEYEKAVRELADAKRMRFMPAGWYEEHVARLKLNHMEARLHSDYNRLKNELQRTLRSDRTGTGI